MRALTGPKKALKCFRTSLITSSTFTPPETQFIFFWQKFVWVSHRVSHGNVPSDLPFRCFDFPFSKSVKRWGKKDQHKRVLINCPFSKSLKRWTNNPWWFQTKEYEGNTNQKNFPSLDCRFTWFELVVTYSESPSFLETCLKLLISSKCWLLLFVSF